MTLELISEARCFDGLQRTYRPATGTPMRVAVFLPPQANAGPVPALWFLAGLGCTEDDFTQKVNAQRVAAKLGLAPIAPDTSPRGEDVPNDPAWDFDQKTGFYIAAIQACALTDDGGRLIEILVEQGLADAFLNHELGPHLVEAACRDAGVSLTLNLRPDDDHSLFFIASMIDKHLRWHGARFEAKSA